MSSAFSIQLNTALFQRPTTPVWNGLGVPSPTVDVQMAEREEGGVEVASSAAAASAVEGEPRAGTGGADGSAGRADGRRV